jgi:hypothetical protein
MKKSLMHGLVQICRLRIIKLFLIGCVSILIGNDAIGQTEKMLLLTPKKAKIKYRLKNSDKTLKGVLKSISNESIEVNDLVISISEFDKFKISKARYFGINKKIQYQLHKDDKKQKGKLLEIHDDYLLVDNSKINIQDISLIGGRAAGLKVAKIIGGGIAVAGSGLTATGLFFISASSQEDGCGAAVYMFSGILLGTVGVVAVGVGSVPIILSSKKYDLGYDWNIFVVNTKK